MIFSHICFTIGLLGGTFLVVSAATKVRCGMAQAVEKDSWISLALAGVLIVFWSTVGELVHLGKLNQGFEVLRLSFGGIGAGILINMLLSRQLRLDKH
jgi:hypothetical protein